MQHKKYKMNVYKGTDGNSTCVGNICADDAIEAVEVLTGRKINQYEMTTYPFRGRITIKAIYKTKAFDIFNIHYWENKKSLLQRLKDKFLCNKN